MAQLDSLDRIDVVLLAEVSSNLSPFKCRDISLGSSDVDQSLNLFTNLVTLTVDHVSGVFVETLGNLRVISVVVVVVVVVIIVVIVVVVILLNDFSIKAPALLG